MSKILVCTKKYTIDDAQSTFTQMRGHENSQDVLDEIAIGYFLDLDYLNYYVSDSSMLENCEVIYEVDMNHRIYYDNENEVYYYVSTDRNDMPMRESMTRVFKRGYFDKYRDPNVKLKTAEDFCRERNITESIRRSIRRIINEAENDNSFEEVKQNMMQLINNEQQTYGSYLNSVGLIGQYPTILNMQQGNNMYTINSALITNFGYMEQYKQYFLLYNSINYTVNSQGQINKGQMLENQYFFFPAKDYNDIETEVRSILGMSRRDYPVIIDSLHLKKDDNGMNNGRINELKGVIENMQNLKMQVQSLLENTSFNSNYYVLYSYKSNSVLIAYNVYNFRYENKRFSYTFDECYYTFNNGQWQPNEEKGKTQSFQTLDEIINRCKDLYNKTIQNGNLIYQELQQNNQ